MRENRFFKAAKIGEKTFLGILRDFCGGLSAVEAAAQNNVSVRTANAIYVRLRTKLDKVLLSSSDAFNGAGANIEAALSRKGLIYGDVCTHRKYIFYELIRCVPEEIAKRLIHRGVRPNFVYYHALEIYIRKKTSLHPSPYFLSIVGEAYDPLHNVL